MPISVRVSTPTDHIARNRIARQALPGRSQRVYPVAMDDRAVIDLARRLSRAADHGKGIRLSPAELDTLVIIGGFEVINRAATEAQKAISQDRRSQLVVTTPARTAPSADAERAMQRARELFDRKGSRRRQN
jgi:hypothetical protein